VVGGGESYVNGGNQPIGAAGRGEGVGRALQPVLAGHLVHLHVDASVALAALHKGSGVAHLHAAAMRVWRAAVSVHIRLVSVSVGGQHVQQRHWARRPTGGVHRPSWSVLDRPIQIAAVPSGKMRASSTRNAASSPQHRMRHRPTAKTAASRTASRCASVAPANAACAGRQSTHEGMVASIMMQRTTATGRGARRSRSGRTAAAMRPAPATTR
jgi:hypothetical protein